MFSLNFIKTYVIRMQFVDFIADIWTYKISL